MRNRSRVLGLLVGLVLLSLGAGGGWWAAHVALVGPDDTVEHVAEPTWATVISGSVGRTLPYSTTVEQPLEPIAYNALTGVVTRVHSGSVDLGDEVYRVGNLGVRAVHVDQPMWRSLSRGDRGEDVRGLQTMLGEMGHFTSDPDGVFGARTERAVRMWQKAEGREQTGVVALGELIAFPRLPSTITLGEDITVGKPLAGGEVAALAPTGERVFTIVLSQDQARQMSVEATVEVQFQDHVWPAVITQTSQNEEGAHVFSLAAPDGGVVCAADCEALPSDPTLNLRSEVVVVPPTTGAAVPIAAVRTDAVGATTVITRDGPVPVEVLGSGQGLAVVTGVEIGTEVLLSESADGAPSASHDGEASPAPSDEETGS